MIDEKRNLEAYDIEYLVGLSNITEYYDSSDSTSTPYYYCALEDCYDEQGKARQIYKHLNSYSHKQSWLKQSHNLHFTTRHQIDEWFQNNAVPPETFSSFENSSLRDQCKKSLMRKEDLIITKVMAHHVATSPKKSVSTSKSAKDVTLPPKDVTNNAKSGVPVDTGSLEQERQSISLFQANNVATLSTSQDLISIQPLADMFPREESQQPENCIRSPDMMVDQESDNCLSMSANRLSLADYMKKKTGATSNDDNSAQETPQKTNTLFSWIGSNSHPNKNTGLDDTVYDSGLGSTSSCSTPGSRSISQNSELIQRPYEKQNFDYNVKKEDIRVKQENNYIKNERPQDLLNTLHDFTINNEEVLPVIFEPPEDQYRRRVRDVVNNYLHPLYTQPEEGKEPRMHSSEEYTNICKYLSRKLRDMIRESWTTENVPWHDPNSQEETPDLTEQEIVGYGVHHEIERYFECDQHYKDICSRRKKRNYVKE